MTAKPPVTVITSTYNWPAALAQAIPTVLSQKYGDFEYLIFGDGCNDETEDVVRGFTDTRITWRNLPENFGNQADVNRLAVNVAQGDYIAYLNHDDLWFDDHLSSLVPLCRDHDLDMINGLSLVISPPPHHYRGVTGLPARTDTSSFNFSPFTSSVVHPKNSAESCGSWRPWRESHEVPTVDFFGRLTRLRGRFGVYGHVTSLKFHSADRLGSYQRKTADEQVLWSKRIQCDPLLRYTEVMTSMACSALKEPEPRTRASIPNSIAPPPGWQIERWRRLRGLPPLLDIGPVETAPAPVTISPIKIQEDGSPLILMVAKQLK